MVLEIRRHIALIKWAAFHTPLALRSLRGSKTREVFLQTLRNLPVDNSLLPELGALLVDCRLLNLAISLSNKDGEGGGVVSRVVPAFREVFQHTFPDKHGLRARVVKEGCRYRISAVGRHDKNYWLVTIAENFMTLSFMLAHCPSMISTFHYSFLDLDDYLKSKGLMECFYDEVAILLAESLESHLQILLEMLQETISRRRHGDWPAIALALCTLLLGVESMQVDIHLQSPKAKSICKSMEDTAILMLTEIAWSNTAGFNPLSLDWEVAKNAALVDNDKRAVDTLRGLQEVRQDYCTKAFPIL